MTMKAHTHTRLMALFRDYPGEPVPGLFEKGGQVAVYCEVYF